MAGQARTYADGIYEPEERVELSPDPYHGSVLPLNCSGTPPCGLRLPSRSSRGPNASSRRFSAFSPKSASLHSTNALKIASSSNFNPSLLTPFPCSFLCFIACTRRRKTSCCHGEWYSGDSGIEKYGNKTVQQFYRMFWLFATKSDVAQNLPRARIVWFAVFHYYPSVHDNREDTFGRLPRIVKCCAVCYVLRIKHHKVGRSTFGNNAPLHKPNLPRRLRRHAPNRFFKRQFFMLGNQISQRTRE